jgi:hypothetical protein
VSNSGSQHNLDRLFTTDEFAIERRNNRMQYISLVTFLFLCLMACLRPGWGFALLILFFALEVAVQASSDVFRSNPVLANLMVGGASLVALLREVATQNRPFFGYFNVTMRLVCVLYVWSIVTVVWTPALAYESHESYNLILEGWPYFLLIILAMPMLISSLKDWEHSLNILLAAGIVVVASVLVNPEFSIVGGRIGISLGGKVRTNPLAIGQMGGVLAILGALYIPKFASRRGFVLLRVGAFVMGSLLSLYSGSRGQVLFAGLVIVMFFPLSRKIRDARTFMGAFLLFGVLCVAAYFAFELVSGSSDINRWESRYVDGATDIRLANIVDLLVVFATTPSAWLIGLGFNAFSSVCGGLGQAYSHCTFADILAELGLPAFVILIAMLVRTCRAGTALMQRYGESPSERSAIATLLAMVAYQVLLANKEGHLWASVNLFMFMIVVDRLEVRSREFGEVATMPSGADIASSQ